MAVAKKPRATIKSTLLKLRGEFVRENDQSAIARVDKYLARYR